ncbi:hypothetical protein [Nostoc sp.]|uniref:hypothetical protein n=1 Tax=Nostoc sp. TaxID=1180 RepID=UPI002FF95B56
MLIILRYLIISTVILTVIMTKAATAQTSNCSFSQLIPGYLVDSGGILPTKLASSSDVGAASEVSVTCDGSFNLIISSPTQTAGQNFTPVSSIATVQTSTGLSTSSDQQSSSLPLSTGITPLSINISVDKGSPIAAGNYAFSVVLTIVP